ncbi:MAG TPA: DUF3347 domain-containing protein [Balneolaceae bacterium]
MTLLKSLLLITLFSISAVTGWAQEHQHREHLSKLVSHYMNVKNALADDNFDNAKSSLIEFREEAMENSEMKNHEEHAQKHLQHHSAMIKTVNKGVQTDDIGELRSAFKDISALLAKALKNQGYEGKTLYIQYCPMAANGGAHWISDQEKIVNPYLGQMMPGCGETRKEINPNN